MIEPEATFSWLGLWTFGVLDLVFGIALGFYFGRLHSRWAIQAEERLHATSAVVSTDHPQVGTAADRSLNQYYAENISSPEYQQELEHALEAATEQPLNEAETTKVLHHFAEVSEEAPLNLERFGTVAEPPHSLLRFVRDMGLSEEVCATNRRGTPRFSFTTTVIVVPIDERSRPIGAPFKAVTRDLATNSISFLHTRSFDTRFFAVQIELPVYGQTTLIVRQVRCQSCGRFYHIAGTLLAKFHSAAPIEMEPEGVSAMG